MTNNLSSISKRLDVMEAKADTSTGLLVVTDGTHEHREALKLYNSDPSNYLLIVGPRKDAAK